MLYSLVSVLQVIAATAPRPIIVQVIGPCTTRTAARRQLSIATGTRYETGHTGRCQGMYEGHFR